MSRSRPRGFIDNYSPKQGTRALLGKVQTVLDEYEEYLPLTLRQVFYRLVARYSFSKKEKSYRQLQEILVTARRAQVIPMEAFRDDSYHITAPWWFNGTAEFVHFVASHVNEFTLDRQQGQSRRLLVWCEAAGMVPQLERVAGPYGICVASSGGFDGVTLKHSIGQSLASEPTTVLHVGDYDPSGVHMFGSLDEDVRAFADHYGGDIEFERIAVLPEHIERYELPTAPPKVTDNRKFDDTRTVQAESLGPNTLAKIVDDAIASRLDMEMHQAIVRQELVDRGQLIDRMDSAGLWEVRQ